MHVVISYFVLNVAQRQRVFEFLENHVYIFNKNWPKSECFFVFFPHGKSCLRQGMDLNKSKAIKSILNLVGKDFFVV